MISLELVLAKSFSFPFARQRKGKEIRVKKAVLIMTKTGKRVLVFLAGFVVACVILVGIASSGFSSNMKVGQLYTGTTDEFEGLVNSGKGDSDPDVMGSKRLSQNITVTNENGTLALGGTVTKSQDPFYPGTYELNFSKKAILSSRALVEVKMNVKAGDKVYVLVGDKDTGYSEFTTVTAQEDNMVSFETNIIQDYTLSLTDVKGAQEAMACVLSSDDLDCNSDQ